MSRSFWRARAGVISALATAVLVSMGGCHSAFVQATVVNRSDKPIELFEMDYPSASFGSGLLAPGASYHYRFKVLGEGAAKLSWTDFQEHEHKATGPRLSEGMEGSLVVSIGQADVVWSPQLRKAQ